MKLTIVAATGGVGQQLLSQALAAGHDVTAVVRDPGKLPSAVRVAGEARVVTADLAGADPGTLEAAIAGGDAVLSGLGPRSSSDAGIPAHGTRAIIGAMLATGVRRIVVVSAAPVGTVASARRPDPPRHDPGDGFFMRYLGSPFAKTAFGKVYADLVLMEDLLAGSGLDWTAVRPPKLTGKPLTGSYRTAVDQNVRGGWSVPRADVAHLMLQVLDRTETAGHAIGIAT